MPDLDPELDDALLAPASLPTRSGPRPRVTGHAPQVQLNQFPQHSLRPLLLQRLQALPGVSFAPSRRAPWGTVGLHLCGAQGGECAFMIDQEFAHVHPGEDGSMHMLLPGPLRSRVIDAGWAEPHPLAGLPTVPKGIVFVYAPRSLQELDVVVALAFASWRNADVNSKIAKTPANVNADASGNADVDRIRQAH